MGSQVGPMSSPRARGASGQQLRGWKRHGLVVEDTEGRFCGAVVSCDEAAVTLESRHAQARRVFPLAPAASCSRANP